LEGTFLTHQVPFPFVPGTSCLGIVKEFGTDAVSSNFKVGDLVLCFPIIGVPPFGILQGWCHFGTEPSQKLADIWRNGCFAEFAQFPVENVVAVKSSLTKVLNHSQISLVNRFCISYGALLSGHFKPSQTVVVGGATGGLGSGCVALALAMGASKVYALGRNKEILDKLAKMDKRVVIVQQKDDNVEAFAKTLKETVNPPADLYLDALGTAKSSDFTVAGMNTVATKGTIVFFGGVQATIPISYFMMLFGRTITGSFMFPQSAPNEVMNMMESGTLKLDWINITEYTLDQVKEAVNSSDGQKGTDSAVFKFD